MRLCRNQWGLILTVALATLLIVLLDGLPNYFVALKETYSTAWVAGDLVIKSTDEIPVPELLQQNDIDVSESIKLSTMLQYRDETTLVHLQFIDSAYPLLGSFVSTSNSMEDGVWVSQNIVDQTGLKIGDNVAIGDAEYKITGIVTRQDEQIFDFAAFSPSVFLPMSEKSNTGLVSNTAKFSYYIYAKLKTGNAEALANQLKESLDKSSRVIVPTESLGRIERVYNQLVKFIDAIKLAGYLMTAALLHMMFSSYQMKMSKSMGMLKVIGYDIRRRIVLFTMPLLKTISLGFLVGSFIGLSTIYLALKFFYDSTLLLEYLSMTQLSVRAFTVFSVFIAIMLPIRVLSTVTAPTQALLSHKKRSDYALSLIIMMMALSIYVAVSHWDSMSFLMLVSNATVCLFLSYMVIYSILGLVSRILSNGGQRSFLVLNGIRLYRQEYIFMALFMTLILTLGVFIWHSSTQLVDSWKNELPVDAPNTFIVGMRDKDPQRMTEMFPWMSQADVFPVIKGRLKAVNGVPTTDYAGGKYINHEVFNRQINLTEFAKMPDKNIVIAGKWPSQGISIESGIMNRIGLKLGDKLTFSLYGKNVELPITSVREVDWQSMRANFYFAFPENALDPFPKTYMTSVFVPSNNKSDVNTMIRSAPYITVIDIGSFLQQARSFISQIASDAYVFLGLVVLSGLASFFFIMKKQKSQRREQYRLMQRLGYDVESFNFIRAELSVMVTISSILTLTLGLVVVGIANQFLRFDWYFDMRSLVLLLLPFLIVYVYTLRQRMFYMVEDEL